MVRSNDDMDEAAALRHALQLMQLQQWTEARTAIHALALAIPGVTRYRALLAYTRGQEAAAAGDLDRANDEWRRALILDPSLKDAETAMKARPRRRSFMDRLRGTGR